MKPPKKNSQWLLLLAMGLTAWQAKGAVMFETLASFTYTNGPTPGGAPLASRMGAMIQAEDGNLYGTIQSGGSEHVVAGWGGFGVLFKVSPAGGYSVVHSFGLTNNSGFVVDGYWPLGNLVKGTDGSLYGTTEYGGTTSSAAAYYGSGYGEVFKFTTNGLFTVLHAFGEDQQPGGLCPFGTGPYAGVIQGSDGNFYGTTYNGAVNGSGAVFQMAPGGQMTLLHAFSRSSYGTNYDGYNPAGELVEGPDGNFYGTAEYGGSYTFGTVFRVTPAGEFTTLISFAGTNGAFPLAGLCRGNDGSLYGTTSASMPPNSGAYGTLFRLTTNGDLTTLHVFTGGEGVDADGASPYGGLIQGQDGNFYGTTYGGGANGYGTVFRTTATGAVTILHSFETPANGANADGIHPMATLAQATDGRFYGTTQEGGAQGYGTVFRLSLTPDAPVLQHIAATNGTVTLSWTASVGAAYQVQYNTELTSTNWVNLGNAKIATQATLSLPDPIGADSHRFYRVLQLP